MHEFDKTYRENHWAPPTADPAGSHARPLHDLVVRAHRQQ